MKHPSKIYQTSLLLDQRHNRNTEATVSKISINIMKMHSEYSSPDDYEWNATFLRADQARAYLDE